MIGTWTPVLMKEEKHLVGQSSTSQKKKISPEYKFGVYDPHLKKAIFPGRR